ALAGRSCQLDRIANPPCSRARPRCSCDLTPLLGHRRDHGPETEIRLCRKVDVVAQVEVRTQRESERRLLSLYQDLHAPHTAKGRMRPAALPVVQAAVCGLTPAVCLGPT